MVQLTSTETETKDHLIEKFRTGSLDIHEAEELIRILEKEKQQAIELGAIALLFAIALLLGVVIDYLSNKKSFWKKIFRK